MTDSGFENSLFGAWKLNYFTDSGGETQQKFNDILIFSESYYSDFHVEKTSEGLILSHVGMYRLTEDTITFQIQLSTHSEYIGRVATGLYRRNGDELRIIFKHGEHPGIWIYSRI